MEYYEMMDAARQMAASQTRFSYPQAMGIWAGILNVYMATNKLRSFESCLDTFYAALKTGILSF